jgi:HEPN domain-containing protein
MANRAKDWLAQAEHDFETALLSRQRGFHEWACFVAQQASACAVKGVLEAKAQIGGCRHVHGMLTALADDLPSTLLAKAEALDDHYLSARYPSCHDSGAPFEHYGPIQSDPAIAYAREIIDYARAQMAQPRDG